MTPRHHEAAIRAALPHRLTATHAIDIPGLGAAITGKGRDAYLIGDQRILITSDRVSAFDQVLGTIPFKGQVLNQLAAWWFDRTMDIVGNHVISVPDPNVLVARNASPLPVEVVVRGYITGVTSTSLWTLYEQGVDRPYGLSLPAGLQKNDALPEPVITPTTKAEQGAHDQRLTSDEVVSRRLVDSARWRRVCDVALALFERGQQIAADRGLILVDTKYEFGLIGDELVLIDEIHTPDSSRYWLADSYAKSLASGQPPEHFDKELLRQWLKTQNYSGDGPFGGIPDDVAVRLASHYIAVYERLTREPFVPGQQPALPRIATAIRREVLSEDLSMTKENTALPATVPIVPIIMGSRSDMAYAEQIGDALTEFDIDSEFRIASAHKSPAHLLRLLAEYEADPRPKVYVTIAGRSNALGGMVDASVKAPVITCPPYSDRFGGADVFSSLRMPSGVAPALVLDPRGAALTVAKILGLGRPELQARVQALQASYTAKLLSDDAEVRGA